MKTKAKKITYLGKSESEKLFCDCSFKMLLQEKRRKKKNKIKIKQNYTKKKNTYINNFIYNNNKNKKETCRRRAGNIGSRRSSRLRRSFRHVWRCRQTQILWQFIIRKKQTLPRGQSQSESQRSRGEGAVRVQGIREDECLSEKREEMRKNASLRQWKG